MDKPKSTEPVSKDQIKAITRTMTPIARMVSCIDDADLSKGRGVLDGNDRCLWTKDKRRITIHISPDCMTIACSKDIDIHCP
jgi:hypothetical protein